MAEIPMPVDLTKILADLRGQESWRRIVASVLLVCALVVTFVAGPTVALVVAFLALASLWMFPSFGRRLRSDTVALRDSSGRVRMVAVAEDETGNPALVLVRSNGEPALSLSAADNGLTAVHLAGATFEEGVALMTSPGYGAVVVGPPQEDEWASLWYQDGRVALNLPSEQNAKTVVTPLGIELSSNGSTMSVVPVGLHHVSDSGTSAWP
jgi:hypothetical protein